ncbi:MAG: hypothetical protein HYR97_03925 [Candidatus Melainabacteria bacterium]|nr:hypothetical protein [Candidatus Melainabacteria bacterium]
MNDFTEIFRYAPRIRVGGPSNSSSTFVDLIKKLNSKYNIGFDTRNLQKEFREAQSKSDTLIDRYAYWETRLIDSIDGRDDFDTILNEFQAEAAKINS